MTERTLASLVADGVLPAAPEDKWRVTAWRPDSMFYRLRKLEYVYYVDSPCADVTGGHGGVPFEDTWAVYIDECLEGRVGSGWNAILCVLSGPIPMYFSKKEADTVLREQLCQRLSRMKEEEEKIRAYLEDSA